MTAIDAPDERSARTGNAQSRLRRIGAMVLLAFAALAVPVFASGCGASSTGSSSTGSGDAKGFYTGGTPGGKPEMGGTLTIVSAEAPASMDPATVAPPGTARPSVSIFDTLAELMPGSKEPQPALAKSWKATHNYRTYTFQIRPGVEFSNGEELTAEDVVYSLLRDKNLPISVCAPYIANLTKATATGPMTVEMNFKEPEPVLIGLLSLPCFGVVPKAVVEKDGQKKFAEHPVGTGPFMVTSTTPGNSKVTMVKNPHFWRKGLPYLDGLVYSQIENDNSRILAVRSGAAQLAIAVPYSQVASLESTPNVQMVIAPIWGAWINPMNTTQAPLNDPVVRRALLYATPYKPIIEAVFKGLAAQANSVVGEMKYWTPGVQPYPYDPEKAKALLKQAGQGSGFDLTIEVQGGETNGELLASILQSAWGEVGVHVSVQTLSSASLFANLFAGKFQMQIIPTESTVNELYDPAPSLAFYLGGASIPTVKPSAALKSLLTKASSTTDQTERGKLFEEVQRKSYAEEPNWLPITNLAALNLASSSVRNYSVLLNGHSRMEEVWLAK
jgi:peptide/nickel transport system substrate-binding protein